MAHELARSKTRSGGIALTQCIANSVARRAGGLFAFVFLARPKKAAQSILLAPGNDVYVQVRNALAYPIVHGHECAVGSEPAFDRTGDALHAGKDSGDLLRRHVVQRSVVALRHDEAVSGKQRMVIEEDDHFRAIVDDVRGKLAGRDAAKQTRGVGHCDLIRIPGSAPEERSSSKRVWGEPTIPAELSMWRVARTHVSWP